MPALDEPVLNLAARADVFVHLGGRLGEVVRVEVGGQVLQVAAAEVVGEGHQSVELVLGQLGFFGQRAGLDGGGEAYCDGNVTVYARDECSGVGPEKIIPGCSRDGRLDAVAGRGWLTGMAVPYGLDVLESCVSGEKLSH